MCRSVDGVDRTLARYQRHAAEVAILRHAARPGDLVKPAGAARETPDHYQLRGTPVIVLKTPAFPREDWAVPQRRRVRTRR